MIAAFRFLREFFSVPRGQPELMQAQYRAFSKQIPLMYFILLTNTWILCGSVYSSAPIELSIYFPMVLTAVCVFRIASWWRSRGKSTTDDHVARALNRTNRLAAVIAIAFTTWSISLFPYGGPLQQAHVAFYMAITVVGCIFCLMHLRSAAFIVALIVNIGFIAFFATSGEPVFIATAANIALVSVTMLIMLLIYYRDFTDMVRARIENHRLANLDPLTNLPNRRRFFSELVEAFATATTNGDGLAVAVVDLDGFKPVNDTYGHVVGDELLIAVGDRLGALCKSIFVARLGGDEFALILRGREQHELLGFGNLVCARLRESFALPNGHMVQIAGSMGIATFPEHDGDAMKLYEKADYALYHSKRNRRGQAVVFTSRHEEELRRDADIQQALTRADLEHELQVVFQPIFSLRSRQIVAYEALARWHSAEFGIVSPAQFIPVAERCDLVQQMTPILLQKALANAAIWDDDIRISFNLSAKDLTSSEGVLRLIATINDSGVSPARIDLEITETSILQDIERVHLYARMLRDLGCGISLDDFGTGFSSLSQLHSLPLTKIKIDRSFVSDLHRKPASYKIVKSMLALARDMGLGCIVEGVESAEETAALTEMGCDHVQGYYFGRPAAKIEAPGQIARRATS